MWDPELLVGARTAGDRAQVEALVDDRDRCARGWSAAVTQLHAQSNTLWARDQKIDQLSRELAATIAERNHARARLHAQHDRAGSDGFDEWCVVELLGHRRLAARVREVQVAGAGMLRLDVPPTDGHGAQTQYVNPGSVYALHPTTETVARAVAARYRPEPVRHWELPAAPAVVNLDDEPEPGDDPDDANHPF